MSQGTAPTQVGAARDVPALLAALQASDPGRPRVTWYSDDGERVELSARVLATWVAKTANLLVEELDANDGSTVLLDLPAHWRTVVWALATWSVGADVVWRPAPRGTPTTAVDPVDPVDPADPTGLPADVVVTDRPGTAPQQAALGHRVAVALPALARSFDGPSGGALDYAAVVAGFGDVFVAPGPLEHRALLQPARGAWPAGVRLLCVDGGLHGGPGGGSEGGLDLRRDLLGALLADGSVVLAQSEPTAAVVASERVSSRSTPPPGARVAT